MIGPLCLWVLAQAPVTEVDRVVAVVDKDVITQSELYAEARILLANQGGDAGAQTEPDADYLVSSLQYLVEQLLISGQARRLGALEVPEEEVDKALRRFTSGFKSEASYQAFLRRIDVSTNRLRDILRRELRNARYAAERMGARVAGKDGSDASFKAAYSQWMVELRSRSDVRLLGPDGTLERQ